MAALGVWECRTRGGQELLCYFLLALVLPMEVSVVRRATLAGIMAVLVALVRVTGAREVFMGSPLDLWLATGRLEHSLGARQNTTSSNLRSRHTFQRLRRALEIARNPATVVKAQLTLNFPADLAHGQELAPHPLLPQFPPNILPGTILRLAGIASNLDHNSILVRDLWTPPK